MNSLLITGAGGSAGHNVCWSLRVSPDGKQTNLAGTDTDRTSLELNRWVDQAYCLPGPNNPNYIRVLNRIVRRHEVELIIPQPDQEVGRVSKETEKLAAATFLPDPGTVSTCLDKFETLSRWHSERLRQEPILVESRFGSAEKRAQSLEFPCWLRARQGAGGLMSCLARTWKEAYHWIMFHWEHGIKTDFIAEEYLPGRDFCFMSIWNKGSLVTSMARERLSWVGNRPVGTGGTSRLNRVVHSERVNLNAVRSIKAVSPKPHGVFCVDLKEDDHGMPIPTEINCRFTTNVHYLSLASVRLARPELNFAWLAAKVGIGEKVPPCKQFNALPGNIWFTKNTDMGFTMVEDGKWRAAEISRSA